MGMILNGIALEGLTRPYGGTFLVFSDYMRPAVRLAAIQQIPVTFVWTHDSVGLGEDGPTHQPIEHLASLRAMPGLAVVRPADANETAQAWAEILRRGTPAGLALSRQNLPIVDRTEHAKATGVAKGAYVLIDAASGSPDVVLVATGSEVSLALAARLLLEKAGVATRVVSMPCREWFEEQSTAYRNKVLPPAVRARVSVEAGVAQGWRDVVGDSGRSVSIEHFGASADAGTLFREFGFTPEAVVKAAKQSLAAARKAGQVPALTDTAPRVPQGHRHRRRDPEGSPAARARPESERPMTSTAVTDLAAHGVSVWLDDLSRERLTSGNLADLIENEGVVGVTTNPSIFQAALSAGHAYDEQVRELAQAGSDRRRGRHGAHDAGRP